MATYRPMSSRKAAMQRQAESIRTNGDAATNDIAPAIYCMHVLGVFLLRGQGAMGDGFHACQVIVTVSVLSCQRFSDRDWAKPHSPLHTPWP